MTLTRLAIAALLAGSAVAATPAFADTGSLGIDFTEGTATDFGGSVWNLGYSFTVNSDVTVFALGNWAGGAPYPQEQQIGLWDSSGNLIASTFVSNSSTAVGQWEFSSIDPVSLSAGQTYVVGGQGGADYTGEVGSVTVDPSITYVTDLYTYNSGANGPLVEPTLTENNPYGWFGGNVLLSPLQSAVPEPATWAMMLLGFGMAGLAMRRRSNVRTTVNYA